MPCQCNSARHEQDASTPQHWMLWAEPKQIHEQNQQQILARNQNPSIHAETCWNATWALRAQTSQH